MIMLNSLYKAFETVLTYILSKSRWQLCCRCASPGGAACHQRIDGIWLHWDVMTSATGKQQQTEYRYPDTPTFRVVSEDRCCPSFTNCARSCRYYWIQESAVPDTPNSVCSRFVSVEWQTVSKVADKSRPISSVTSLLSAAVWTLSRTSSSSSRSNVLACRPTAAWWSSWSWWGGDADVPAQVSRAPWRLSIS